VSARTLRLRFHPADLLSCKHLRALSKGRKGESKREREREREREPGSQFTAIYEIFIVPMIHAESQYFYRRRVFSGSKNESNTDELCGKNICPVIPCRKGEAGRRVRTSGSIWNAPRLNGSECPATVADQRWLTIRRPDIRAEHDVATKSLAMSDELFQRFYFNDFPSKHSIPARVTRSRSFRD